VSRSFAALIAVPVVIVGAVACRDISRFSTAGDSYDGAVVKAGFVRAGVDEDVRACVTLDTDHLQDTPGRISTSDGRLHAEALRPIPQLWHDPLSTLSFGEGRDKNLVYVASPTVGSSDGGTDPGGDVMVVLSLMSNGDVEVRLLRGAPPASDGTTDDAGAPATGAATNLFAVFQLSRQGGPCSY
jgi:hypothetical protein